MAMLFLAVSFLAGIASVASPCIIPVAPFVLSRGGRPLPMGLLPLLAGLALAFTAVVALAAVSTIGAARAHEAGRWLALGVLAVVAATLLSERAAQVLTRPFVALGERLSVAGGSFLTGVATGLLWSPCAGPVLALVLAGGAADGRSAAVVPPAIAYALGAATALGLIVAAGRRFRAAARRSFALTHGLRQAVGVAALLAVLAIATGFDTSVLARVSTPTSIALETGLLDALGRSASSAPTAAGRRAMPADTSGMPVLGSLPPLEGATGWLNGAPVRPDGLRGKVVLVQVWTYSCINCIRTLPFVRAWDRAWRDKGLAVIGVHAPEFAFERDPDNVRRALERFGLTYPVALDNDFRLWRALGARAWPTLMVVDAQGRIRMRVEGEGDEARVESAIQALLADVQGPAQQTPPATAPDAPGEQAAADWVHLRSGESYLGFAKAGGFASPEPLTPGRSQSYSIATLRQDQWALSGTWTVVDDRAMADAAGGRIAIRFRARDLHLVLGPGAGDRPVRFQVTIDGRAPGPDHGADTDEAGFGVVSGARLHQLVRQSGDIRERLFEVRFLDTGVEAFAFTFG